MNLSWGSPLSLAGGSSKTHQLPGTLRPCVLCWGPLVHGDVILRRSINSLRPDIAARCPLPDSLPAAPLPPALRPLFPLGREEGAASGPGHHSTDKFPRALRSSLQLTEHSSGWNFLTEATPLTKAGIPFLQLRVQDARREKENSNSGSRA